jgi:CheY-like chemotaxis protein
MAPDASQDLLVVEAAASGLLTLLAHSALSGLPRGAGPVKVSTAVTAGQGITALTQAPFRCVVLDLGVPFAADFLDQVAQKAELRGIPVLGYARDARRTLDPARTERLSAALRGLELLASLDDVRERLTAYLSAGGPVQPVTAAAVAEPARPAKLARHEVLRDRKALVIDDDPRNVFAIASILRQQGMSVADASSGQEGINALLAVPDTDVVLMDIMMPGMDGYAAMTVIRQMPEFARLPIIAVTARAMPGDRDKSIAAGATDYVTKPVDPEKLLSRIEHWVSAPQA